MKLNAWTLALASVGIISLESVQAEEHSVLSTVASTTLSGYVDTSAIWKLGAGTTLPGRSFDGGNKVDGFNLNAIKLSLEKPLGDAVNWSGGYKADLIFGPDANYYGTLLNGGANTTGGTASGDDFAVKQAYVALRAPLGNGLDIKMGVFDTIVGYEYFESPYNNNYSRSYGYYIEPTHHTGLLLSYKVADPLTITAGVANGYAGGINSKSADEEKKAWMAALTLTMPDGAGPLKGSTFSVGIVSGRNTTAFTYEAPTDDPDDDPDEMEERTSPEPTEDTRNYYAGFTLNTPIEGFQIGFAYDLREDADPAVLNANLAARDASAKNEAHAMAVYIIYGMDKWRMNLRGDYTHATDGTYYDGTRGDGGESNEIGSITATFDYNLWDNVLTRLEARWDTALHDEGIFGVGNADKTAFTVALNAIYKF